MLVTASFLAASCSSCVSTSSPGSWTYRTTEPRMKQFFTDLELLKINNWDHVSSFHKGSGRYIERILIVVGGEICWHQYLILTACAGIFRCHLRWCLSILYWGIGRLNVMCHRCCNRNRIFSRVLSVERCMTPTITIDWWTSIETYLKSFLSSTTTSFPTSDLKNE